MELSSKHYWEKIDSVSLPGTSIYRLCPSHHGKYAVVAYYKRDGKWLHHLPFGEGMPKEGVRYREDWVEMPEHITTLEEAKTYVETLWRLE